MGWAGWRGDDGIDLILSAHSQSRPNEASSFFYRPFSFASLIQKRFGVICDFGSEFSFVL